MRKIVMPLAAAILMSAASVAMAATATGTIKNIDHMSKSITLNNGKTFSVPATQLSSLKKGERVNVTYSNSNGQMQASAVSRAS